MANQFGLPGGSLDYSNAAADEFHDWLDTEHIPERLRSDFDSARRAVRAAMRQR